MLLSSQIQANIMHKILHILTATPSHAQTILSAALQAGFRESGALNLLPSGKEPATPMVAVRSMGLSLSSLVGRCGPSGDAICNISDDELRTLIEIGNKRFKENEKRITRFRELLRRSSEGKEWEDSKSRGGRKRREGLEKRELMRRDGVEKDVDGVDVGGFEILE